MKTEKILEGIITCKEVSSSKWQLKTHSLKILHFKLNFRYILSKQVLLFKTVVVEKSKKFINKIHIGKKKH